MDGGGRGVKEQGRDTMLDGNDPPEAVPTAEAESQLSLTESGLRRYRGFIFDSARWDDFSLRSDDVLVTTPSKTGTTWVQTICALLILGPPPWGQPLADISPWLDMNVEPVSDVHARLEAQTHRRVIKTHTPLDGLPAHPGVRYLTIGRDPRDVGLSWDGHIRNIDFEQILDVRLRAVGGDDLADLGLDLENPPAPPPEDPVERFRLFVDNEDLAVQGGSLLGFAHHMAQAWEKRDRDDLLLLHYADLRADLPGEMRRIADFLDIEVDEGDWPVLVDPAGFDAMRARADDVVPAAPSGIWQNHRAFFAEGRLGGWRSLPPEVLRRYDERAAELFPDDLRRWLEHEPPSR